MRLDRRPAEPLVALCTNYVACTLSNDSSQYGGSHAKHAQSGDDEQEPAATLVGWSGVHDRCRQQTCRRASGKNGEKEGDPDSVHGDLLLPG